MNNKLFNKHLFFISKSLNWDVIPEDRKLEYVRQYALGVQHPSNKRQDLARALYNLKNEGIEVDSNKMLELAIQVGVLK